MEELNKQKEEQITKDCETVNKLVKQVAQLNEELMAERDANYSLKKEVEYLRTSMSLYSNEAEEMKNKYHHIRNKCNHTLQQHVKLENLLKNAIENNNNNKKEEEIILNFEDIVLIENVLAEQPAKKVYSTLSKVYQHRLNLQSKRSSPVQ